MFKSNWEKTSTRHSLPPGLIEKMAVQAYPHLELRSYQIIDGGCANLNIKIQFKNDTAPRILRVYLRDKDAAYKEQKLALLLKPKVPAPEIYYIGNIEAYQFSIMEFIFGITLRDLLLSDHIYDMPLLMCEVGTLISKIAAFTFPLSGLLDKNLEVIDHPIMLFDFAKECLEKQDLMCILGPELVLKIHKLLDRLNIIFTEENEHHLVHGDFDPANILVNNSTGTWHISGILDFEFSFSGSVLWDVANMLRYAHHMPPQFQNAFIAGLEQKGLSLPKNWQIKVSFFNILSLLDCLKRTTSQTQPHQSADIHNLICHYVAALGYESLT